MDEKEAMCTVRMMKDGIVGVAIVKMLKTRGSSLMWWLCHLIRLHLYLTTGRIILVLIALNIAI